MELDDIDMTIDIKDSLKRQLQEIHKQIRNEKNKNQAQDLMLKKKLENARANHILNSLFLQKQLEEMIHLYQYSKQQWDIELQCLKTSIQFSKISTLTQIQEILRYDTLIHLDKQTANKMREHLEYLDEPLTNRMMYENIPSVSYMISEEGLLDDRLPHSLFTHRLKRILNGDASTERLASEAVTQNKLNHLKEMIDKFIEELQNKECEYNNEETRTRSRKNTQIRIDSWESGELVLSDNSVLHIASSFEKMSSTLEFSILSFSSDHEESTSQELISASNYSVNLPSKTRVNDSMAVEKTCLLPFQDSLSQRMYAESSEPASKLLSPDESSQFIRKKNKFNNSESSTQSRSWRNLVCPCFFK